MKIFLRLIKFCQPIGRYAVPYTIFTTLAIIFGLLNFSLLIPLLNVLFGNIAPDALEKMLVEPTFSWSLAYGEQLFYYYFSHAIHDYGKMYALQFVTASVVTSVLLSNLFRYLSAREIESLKIQTVKNIRDAVFAKVILLDVAYFSKEQKGNIMTKLTEDVGRVETSLTNTLSVFFKEPLTLIVYFVTLITISYKVTLCALAVLPFSAGAISYFVKRLRKDSKEFAESYGRLMSLIEESLGGIRVIKAFANENYITKRFKRESTNMFDAFLRAVLRRELASPVSEFFGVISVAIILLYGGSLVLEKGELTASQFITYIIIFSQIMRPAKTISTALTGAQVGMVSGQRVLEILDHPIEVFNNIHGLKANGLKKELKFENVSFFHGTHPILKNVNQTFEAGKMYALVGTSGGGKSTLIDLIIRYYDPQKGKITWDGEPLDAYELGSVRRNMGVVTQESILFNDTIFENIVFGRTDITEEQVIAAAKIANAHEFIEKTELGYQTPIGDRGVRLSGGQKQRICIARAILQNPPILILDEATSALDTESEKLVQEALNNLLKDRTSIVIAHRLSTIQHADEILVIDKGEIKERGTHETLLSQPNGLYSKLIALQKL